MSSLPMWLQAACVLVALQPLSAATLPFFPFPAMPLWPAPWGIPPASMASAQEDQHLQPLSQEVDELVAAPRTHKGKGARVAEMEKEKKEKRKKQMFSMIDSTEVIGKPTNFKGAATAAGSFDTSEATGEEAQKESEEQIKGSKQVVEDLEAKLKAAKARVHQEKQLLTLEGELDEARRRQNRLLAQKDTVACLDLQKKYKAQPYEINPHLTEGVRKEWDDLLCNLRVSSTQVVSHDEPLTPDPMSPEEQVKGLGQLGKDVQQNLQQASATTKPFPTAVMAAKKKEHAQQRKNLYQKKEQNERDEEIHRLEKSVQAFREQEQDARNEQIKDVEVKLKQAWKEKAELKRKEAQMLQLHQMAAIKLHADQATQQRLQIQQRLQQDGGTLTDGVPQIPIQQQQPAPLGSPQQSSSMEHLVPPQQSLQQNTASTTPAEAAPRHTVEAEETVQADSTDSQQQQQAQAEQSEPEPESEGGQNDQIGRLQKSVKRYQDQIEMRNLEYKILKAKQSKDELSKKREAAMKAQEKKIVAEKRAEAFRAKDDVSWALDDGLTDVDDFTASTNAAKLYTQNPKPTAATSFML